MGVVLAWWAALRCEWWGTTGVQPWAPLTSRLLVELCVELALWCAMNVLVSTRTGAAADDFFLADDEAAAASRSR